MPDEFDFLDETPDEEEGELPSWLEEEMADADDDTTVDDRFERLRQQAVLAADDLYEEVEARQGSGRAGFFSQLTASQRLVLALLFLLNVIIVAVGILIVTGTLTF